MARLDPIAALPIPSRPPAYTPTASASVSASASVAQFLRPKHQVMAQTSSSFLSRRAAVSDSM